MTDFAQLVLAADTRQMTGAEKAIDRVTAAGGRAEKGMDRLDKETKQASASVKKLAGTADGATAVLKRLGAAAATAFGAKAILSAAETYTKMDNSLRALGLSADQAQRRLSEIAGIATRTRAPMESTVQLYSRLSLAAGELGASSKQLSQFTETVGMSLSAAGIGANEASGSLLQLSQALSGGIVRAEEFNSIVEGAFPIARLAAQGIDEAGGSVARLRNLVIKGKISSKEFFDAILEGSASAKTAFGQTSVTMGQAMTALNNSFVMLAGGVDRALGASAAIANAVVFVADNLGRFASYAVAAGGAFAGAYVFGLLNAARATMTLTGALTLLRGALIRTGIGALVIGAGELIYQFSQLVERVGGVGNAFSLLGDVVAGVWTGMIDSAAAIPPALNGIWEKMKGGFLLALSGMATALHDFIWNIANSFQGVPGFDTLGNKLMGVAAAADAASGSLARSGHAAQAAAAGSFEKAGKTISDAFGPARDAVAALNNAVSDNATVTEYATETASKFNSALDDADKKAKKLNKDLEKTPQIVDDMADAWGNFVVNGFKDFKGFTSNVLGSFKNMIAQMISAAAKSKILSYLGFGGAATAASATAASAGGLTALAGAGGVAGAVGGVASGLGGILSGGGLSASFANLGGLMTGATAGWGAIGAALPAVGVIAAAISFFSKKTKELDAGIRLSADGFDVLGESFRKIETSRFWGLSKKTSTEFTANDALTGALDQTLSMVRRLGDSLDLGADKLNDFATEIQVSTKGLSEEEIATKVQEAIAKFGDEAAAAIGGGSLADLIFQFEAPQRRLAELLQSDPLLGYQVELMHQEVGRLLKFYNKTFSEISEITADNMSDMVNSVSAGFGTIASAANRVRDYLMTTLGNLNEILGYGAGGPMGNLGRIGDTIERIIAPAEAAIAQINQAYDTQIANLAEVQRAGTATAAEMSQMLNAAQAASAAINQAMMPIQLIRGGYSTLSNAIADFFAAQVDDGLKFAFPEAAQGLSSFVKGIIGTVGEGSVSEFEGAFVNLTDAFGEGKVSALEFETAMRVMDQVFRGNISLTDQYTKRQQEAVDKLAASFGALENGLNSIIEATKSGIDALTQQSESLTQQTVARGAALSYLRGVAASGALPMGDQSALKAAIKTATSIDATGFRTATDMLRYIAQTSAVLSDIQGQAEEQLTDAQMQVQAILNIEETSATSAEALVSIDAALQEFLGAGGRIPGFASGGRHSGGFRVVGEQGAELEYTGASNIIPNSQIQIGGGDAALRREVVQMRVDLHNALAQIAKNTRKSSDTLNKFDYQGMPSDRGF